MYNLFNDRLNSYDYIPENWDYQSIINKKGSLRKSFEFRDTSLPRHELGSRGIVIELRDFLEMARNKLSCEKKTLCVLL
jgi:hypothetical protein